MYDEEKRKKNGVLHSRYYFSMTDCKLSFNNPDDAVIETCNFCVEGQFTLSRLTIDKANGHTFSRSMFESSINYCQTIDITNCVFSDMTFKQGRFISLESETISVTNCSFKNVTSLGRWTSIILNSCTDKNSQLTLMIDNMTVENVNAPNAEEGGGMAIGLDPGSLLTVKGSQTLFKSCGCDTTKTGKGGGIYVEGDLDVELMFEKEIKFDDNHAFLGTNIFIFNMSLETVVQKDHFLFAADDNGVFSWKENELMGTKYSPKTQFIEDFYDYSAEDEILNLFMFLSGLKSRNIYLSQNGKDHIYCGLTVYPCESIAFSTSQFDIKNTNSKTLHLPAYKTTHLSKAVLLEKELSSVAFSVAGVFSQSNNEQMAEINIMQSIEALSDAERGSVNCHCTTSFHSIQFDLPDKFISTAVLPTSVISWMFDSHSAYLFLDKCSICAPENVLKPLEYRFLCGEGGSVKIVDTQMIGKDESKITTRWEESPFLISKMSGDLTISGLTMERIEVIDGACVSVTSGGESSELKVSIANSSFKSITSTCGREGGALSIKLNEENAAFQLKGNDATSFTSCAAEGCQSKGGGLFLEMTGENSLFQVPKSSSFVVFGKGNRATFGTGMYFVWDNLQTKKEDLTPLGEGLTAAENVVAVCDRGAMEKELDLFVYLKVVDDAAKSDEVYAGKSDRAELCLVAEYPCHLVSSAMKRFAADDKQKRIIVCGEVEIETDLTWGSTTNKEIVISSLPFNEELTRNVNQSHFTNAQSSRKSQKNNQFERSRMVLTANAAVKAQGDAAVKNTHTLTIEHITFLINEMKRDFHPSCLISSDNAMTVSMLQSTDRENVSELSSQSDCSVSLTDVYVLGDVGTERVTTLNSLLEINSGSLLISGLQISTQFTFAKSPISLADLLILAKITALKIGTEASSSPSAAFGDNNDNYLIVQEGPLIEINRNTINMNGDFSFIESANGPALINIGRDGHAIVSNSHIKRCLNGAASDGKGGVFGVSLIGELVLRNTTFESCGMKGEGGWGGAIYVTGSAELELHSCIIKDCFTGKGGKGCGGGLFIDKDLSEFVSEDTIISGCTTYGGCGGGIYANAKAEGNLVQAQIKMTFEGNGREEEDATAKGKDIFISDTHATEMTAEANPFYLCGTSEVGRKVYYSNLAIEPAVEKEEEGWLGYDIRKRKVNTNEGTTDANCGLSNEQPCKTIKTAIDLFPTQVGAGDDAEKTVELSEESDESEKETILVSKKKVAIEGKLREDRRIASIIITNLEVAGTLFAIDTDGTLNLKDVQITHNSKHEENCQSSLFQVNEGSQRANLILQNIQISTEAVYSLNKHFTASLIKSYSGKVRISDISISTFGLEQPAISIVGATSSLVIGGNTTLKFISQPTTDSPAGILINTGDEPIDVAIEGISIVDANAPASTKGGGICVFLSDESSSFHLCHEEAISSKEKVTLSGCRVSGEAGKGGCIFLSMKQSVDVKFPKYKANILFDSEGDVKSDAFKGKYLFFEAKSLLNCINNEKFGFLIEDYETYGDWPNLIGLDEAEFVNEEIELFRLIFATAENVIKINAKDGKDVTWCGGERNCKSFSYGVSRLDFESANPSLFLLGSNPFPVSEQLVCKGSEGNLKICGDSSSDAKANLVFAAEFSLSAKEDDSKESCILFESGTELENIIASVPEMFMTDDLEQPQAIFELRGTSGCLKLNKVTFTQRDSKTERELFGSHILRKDLSMKTIHSTTDLGSEYRLVLINDGSAEFVEVKLEKPETKDFLLFQSSPFFFSVSSGGHCTLSSCTFSGIKITVEREAVVEMKSCEGATNGATFTIRKCTFTECVSSKGVEGGALSIKSSLDTSRIRFLDDGPTSFANCQAEENEGRGGGLYIFLHSNEEPFGGVEFPKKKENFVIEGNCNAHEGKGIFLDVSDLSATVKKENFAFAELIDKAQRESLLYGRDDSVFTDKPIDLYSFLLDEYFSDVIFLKGENVDAQQALTSSQASFAFCGHFNAPCKSFGEGTKHFPKDSQRNRLVIEKKAFAEYTYFWTKFDELFVSGEPETFFKKTDLTENECSAIEDDNQYGILDFPSSLTTENDYQAVMSFDYPITFSHLVVSFPPSFKADTSFGGNACREENHSFKGNQQAGFVPRGLYFCNGAGTNGKISFEFCTFQLSSAPTSELNYYIISSTSGMISFKDVIFDGAQQATKYVSESPNINSHANGDEKFVLFNLSPIRLGGDDITGILISNSLFSHISIAQGPLFYLERLQSAVFENNIFTSICRNGDEEMEPPKIGGSIIDVVEQKAEYFITISGTQFSQCTSPLSKQGGAISIESPKSYVGNILKIDKGSSFEKCACNKDEGRGGAISFYYSALQDVTFSKLQFEDTNEAKIGKNIWVGFSTFDMNKLRNAFYGLRKFDRYEGAENEYAISIEGAEALETDLIPILNLNRMTVAYVSNDGNDDSELCGIKVLPCKTVMKAHSVLSHSIEDRYSTLKLLSRTVLSENIVARQQIVTVIESADERRKEIAEIPANMNRFGAEFQVVNILLVRNIEFICGAKNENSNDSKATYSSKEVENDNEMLIQSYYDAAFLIHNIQDAKLARLSLVSCTFTAGADMIKIKNNLICVDGGELDMDDVLFDGMGLDCNSAICVAYGGEVALTGVTIKNCVFVKYVIGLYPNSRCKLLRCLFSSLLLTYNSVVETFVEQNANKDAEEKHNIEFDDCEWRNITGYSCLSYSSKSRNGEIKLTKCSFSYCDSKMRYGIIFISSYQTNIITLNRITMFNCLCNVGGAVYISLLEQDSLESPPLLQSPVFSSKLTNEQQGNEESIIFHNCLFIGNISDSLVCHVCLCDSRKDFIKNTVFDDLCYSSSKTESVYLDVKVDPSQSGWKDNWMQYDTLERFVDEKKGADSEGCGRTKANPCKTIGSAIDESSNLSQKKLILMGKEFILKSTLHTKESIIEIFSLPANEMEAESKTRILGESNENDFAMFDISSGGKMHFKDLCLVNDADKITGAGVSKIISLTDEGEEVSLESCDISGENTKEKVLTTILVHISCGTLKMSSVNVRFDGGDTTRPAIVCEECVKSIIWSGGSMTDVNKKGDTVQRGSALYIDGRNAKSIISVSLKNIIFDNCVTSESDCGGAVTLFVADNKSLTVLHSLKFKKCGSDDEAKGKGGGLYVSFEEFTSSNFPISFNLISFEDCSAAVGKDLAIQNEKGMDGITSSLFNVDFEELYHKENLFVVIDGAGKAHDLLSGPDALPYSSSKIYMSYSTGTNKNDCGMQNWECKTIEYGIQKLSQNEDNECFLILETDTELDALCRFVKGMTLQASEEAERKVIKVANIDQKARSHVFYAEATGKMKDLAIEYTNEVIFYCKSLITITSAHFSMIRISILPTGEINNLRSASLLDVSKSNMLLNDCQFAGLKQESYESAFVRQLAENKNKIETENNKMKNKSLFDTNMDECAWSEGQVSFQNSDVTLNNVTIERSYQSGGLSLIQCGAVRLRDCLFRENGADISSNPSFPSIRRNIMCEASSQVHSSVELESLQDESDGKKEGTMLWMYNSASDLACHVSGKVAYSMKSLLFTPSIESVEAKEEERRLHVTVGGKLLLPCFSYVCFVGYNDTTWSEYAVDNLKQESEDKFLFSINLQYFIAKYFTVKFYYNINNERIFIESNVPWNNTHIDPPIVGPQNSSNVPLIVGLSVGGTVVVIASIVIIVICCRKYRKNSSKYQSINGVSTNLPSYFPHHEESGAIQYQSITSSPRSLYY
eukprot:MONOS_10230.1-p1 / transcript=MONOS_10230.1 / gene=MONOS_10230 / organism=Monocercomonoides_exilis_PA203 / gene_product=unspecified product / transcript_product=unspecified product / location=Mono_scaffold00456:19045-30291(-) / protein_length=3749 / sequence_SO=supercontig / SO=protein_coding / is_pseudo=false